MTTAPISFSKAFAVWWQDLERWDIGFFRRVNWQWPKEQMAPLATLLERKQVEIDSDFDKGRTPIIAKISFGGLISISEVDQFKSYKGRLFLASSGDLIYSKIRVKQGSLAVVPKEIPQLAVSAEYPVYWIRTNLVNPDYLALVLKSRTFLSLFERLSHGGSTKTRIPPAEFERQEIPLPPLPIQNAIVDIWERTQSDIADVRLRAEARKTEIEARFFADLGLAVPRKTILPKCCGVWWTDFHRWSVSYNRQRLTGLDITRANFGVVNLGSIAESVQYGTSEKANTTGNGIPIIRMNNIVDGHLDLSKVKYVALGERERSRLLVEAGDILFNRTNSKELVGKCAVFEEEGEYVFASYLIRVRVDRAKANPAFVVYVINSNIGRQQIDAVSRQIIGQANVNSQELQDLLLPLPPLEVQDKIISRVKREQAKISFDKMKAEQLTAGLSKDIEAMILGKIKPDKIK